MTAAPPGDRAGGIGAGPPERTAVAAGASTPPAPRTVARRLLRSPTFLVGAAVLVFWIVCAIFGYSIAPYSPTAISYSLHAVNAAPSAAHWFGTDPDGRDVLSRVLVGSRAILQVTPLATLLGTAAGTVLGLVMGYFGGLVDLVLGRLVDAVLALPLVIVAFLLIVALGASTLTLIVVIGAVFTPLIGRTVRSAVLGERELEYVATARLRGERAPYIMFVEILPNVLAPILVEFGVRLGYAVFTVATLSYLGFGIQPPTPDWGVDISANYIGLSSGYWWETLFPALAIASLVVSINLVSDAVEKVLAG